MTTLVAGASGATGKHLVEQLLQMGQQVKVIVRPSAKIINEWNSNEAVTIIRANISEMTADDIAVYANDCQAIGCCLGHNLTVKGLFGKPRKLVANAVELLCNAVEKNSPENSVKFVLMSSVAVRYKDLGERVSLGQKITMGIIRLLTPPHRDNEKAADYLRFAIGQKDPKIQWAAVRPDSLINEDRVTEYQQYASPTKSLFNPGKTSRINVGNFMARLIVENDLWEEWKGKMPAIYNNAI